MKKNFLTLCILLLNFASSYSQNWLLLGNASTNPSLHFLGTTDGQPLNIKTSFTTTPQPINFYTNNTSLRMTILGSGEVGVGITTPTYRLDVQDNINLRPGAFGDGYRWWDGSTGVTILHTNSSF